MLYGPVNDFLKRRIEVQDPPRLADFAASLTSAKPELLQELMETLDVQERLDRALLLLKTEVEKSKLRKEIKESVEQKIGETQRKYMLNEQLKEIKNELGLEKDDKASLLEKFRTRLAAEGIVIPEEAQKTIDEEMSK
jgi:ATP-dependent Lon protease|tara:strand:+ start:661 stop:1074 length:414 start_codon:yes stop_codon:yes gene_type:complete